MTPNAPAFHITILGSGTCVPSLRRSSCAVLVEIEGSKLLVDSGAGTLRRMLQAQTTLDEIDTICYSHFHPDHTGELVPFLFASKYPQHAQRRKPLRIIAGQGFATFYKGLKSVYGQWVDLGPGMLDIVEMDTSRRDSRTFDRFTVETLPVAHRQESIAIRIISSAGHAVVYSGDTDVCENLVDIAKGADVFICESALPDALKAPGHLTPSLAGTIAARANVGKLVLTHFYPECDSVDLAKECRKTYTGPLILAEDLLRIEVG